MIFDAFIADALANPTGRHRMEIRVDGTAVEVHGQRDGTTLVRGHHDGVIAEMVIANPVGDVAIVPQRRLGNAVEPQCPVCDAPMRGRFCTRGCAP